MKNVLVAFLILSVFCSCSADRLEIDNVPSFNDFELENPADSIYIHDIPENDGVRNALKKAEMMASIKWIPISNVPSVYSSPYFAGDVQRGIPYSLANVSDSYVGLNASLYTFMTAVNNPRSVMYTENLRSYPYQGSDCAPYYGAVCASSVQYILGIPGLYYARSYGKIKGLKQVQTDNIDDLILCDVLQTSKHISMIYDICRSENGAVEVVYVFETTRSDNADSRIIRFTRDMFIDAWKKRGWKIYRYSNIASNIIPFSDLEFSSKISGYQDICTSLGDRSVYLEGETVILNILNNSFSTLILYKDGMPFLSSRISSLDACFSDLPYGSYQAEMISAEGKHSSSTYFEVLDATVSAVGNSVSFSSRNAIPLCAILCDYRCSPEYSYTFTESQLASGTVTVLKHNTFKYCKVQFKGEYGIISSPLVVIE